jgi:hypothetical protein
MSGMEFDFSGIVANMAEATARVKLAARHGVQDSVDDLKAIAVDITPIDSTDLRRSAFAKVTQSPTEIIGEVSFRAEEHGFNYAIWIHEGSYNLGPDSLQAQESNTRPYPVGNKYLERPLRGEANKYMRWIAEEIRDVVGD